MTPLDAARRLLTGNMSVHLVHDPERGATYKCLHCSTRVLFGSGDPFVHAPTCPTRAAPKILAALAATLSERTPDGDPRVWLLFGPSLFTLTPELHHWTRPCSVFSSQAEAVRHLAATLGDSLASSLRWEQHELFPELELATDSRGYRWLLTWAPVDAGMPDA